MGNMLPCLVLQDSKRKLHSCKLVMKSLHKMKRPTVEVVTSNNPDCKAAALRSKAHRKEGDHQKGVIRVKVVLTKKEAARLLSLTVRGEKTVAQIMRELKRMEAAGRVNAAGPASTWRPALESIPEEW